MADNLAFEERISPARLSAYGAHPALTPEWGEHHRAYVGAWINRSGMALPETFAPVNAPAHLDAVEDNQTIIRLEEIDWRLARKGIARADFQRWWEVAKGIAAAPPYEVEEAREALEDFVEDWNGARDNRPIFAGFADEVGGELAATDWADRLRDRWGLGHHDPAGGRPITVLLMRYPVSFVRRHAVDPSAAPFARPTVLDGPLNDCFFPAPGELPFGRTLDLQSDSGCARHVAEILHQRIDYRVSHIDRLGAIRQARPSGATIAGYSLKARRNEHLFCLRYHSGRHDFGQDIPAHVVD
ncbi:hypothetical protein ABMY26_14830 [Azospirillum sp. HJ39]|uniref:hypothetical protein n=1 Tax=Azospirillum sp. HJ39 TaxID=3159496 RepID=UPI003558DF47